MGNITLDVTGELGDGCVRAWFCSLTSIVRAMNIDPRSTTNTGFVSISPRTSRSQASDIRNKSYSIEQVQITSATNNTPKLFEQLGRFSALHDVDGS